MESELKRRFLVFILLTSIFVTTSLILSQVFNPSYKLLWEGIASVVILCVILYLAVKSRRSNTNVLTHFFVMEATTSTFIASARSGGFSSNIMQWYASILIIAVLMLPASSAYFWVAISIIESLLLIFFFSSHEQTKASAIVSTIGFQIMVLLVVWFYDRIQKLYRKEVETQSQNRELLLRVISHDLRNPMQVIVTAAERILSPNIDLQKASTQILSGTDAIVGILDHTREQILLMSSKIKLNPAIVDVSQVAMRAMQNVEELAANKGITVGVKLRGRSPFLAFVDEQRFHDQVLENLLTNAIKFSPPGSKVRVSLARTPGLVSITIHDQGIGIPRELRSQLFDSSPVIKRRGTAGETGSGFGLSIAKSYVKLMGGTIRVRSQEKLSDGPTGTSIMVAFPRTSAKSR